MVEVDLCAIEGQHRAVGRTGQTQQLGRVDDHLGHLLDGVVDPADRELDVRRDGRGDDDLGDAIR